MNWVSHSKQPDEKQRQKDFFRRNRPPVFQTAPETLGMEFSSFEQRKSRSPAERNSPLDIDDPADLAALPLKSLSRIVQSDDAKMSTELVNQELMRRLFHHEKRPGTGSTPENRSPYFEKNQSLQLEHDFSSDERLGLTPENRAIHFENDQSAQVEHDFSSIIGSPVNLILEAPQPWNSSNSSSMSAESAFVQSHQTGTTKDEERYWDISQLGRLPSSHEPFSTMPQFDIYPNSDFEFFN